MTKIESGESTGDPAEQAEGPTAAERAAADKQRVANTLAFMQNQRGTPTEQQRKSEIGRENRGRRGRHKR